jgi:hypothetical protein
MTFPPEAGSPFLLWYIHVFHKNFKIYGKKRPNINNRKSLLEGKPSKRPSIFLAISRDLSLMELFGLTKATTFDKKTAGYGPSHMGIF